MTNCMKAANTLALALVLVVSPIYAKVKHAPLPASVMTAKTVYIDNQTGHPEITDRAYDALSKWGRFKILKNEKDADLVLRITANTKGRPNPPATDIDRSPTPIIFSVRDQANTELWSASMNKPFHSQTRLDIAELQKRIQEQEKGN
jgi:hypothetical protein